MIETDGSDADMFKASRFATGSREPNGIWARFQHLASVYLEALSEQSLHRAPVLGAFLGVNFSGCSEALC